MNESPLSRLQHLFDHAVELPDGGRDAFLAALTGADAELRDDLQRLLARHRASRLLPDQPALAELDRALQTLAPEALEAARTIGPFRIDGVIGDGGMGRVYRASREHDGIVQRVAIKLVRPERVNASLLQRFSTERRLLAALDHPNVCRFIDAGTLHDRTPYVVMELIDGEPLNAYCDTNQLTIPQRLQLLRKLLSAVAHAHRKLIVHRDIKAANVLVDRNGEPRLLDFGIAKSLADELGATATAERFFSPASAAPEQIRGDPVTVACDVYALGVLVYELLSGRMPFDLDGLSAGEVERLLLTVPPLPMSERVRDHAAAARSLPNATALRRSLRGDLDAVVQKCLRKSANERYASVEQLDAEFARIEAGQPVHVRGGDRLYRIRKFIGRNRAAVGLSTSLALALTAGGIGIVLQNVEMTAQRNAAVRERDRAQQVVELLQQSFAAANPLGAAGGDVTATEILEAARTRIDLLFDERPDVYARLAVTIARLEVDLRRYAQAAKLGARAVDAARRSDDDVLLRDALVTEAQAAAQMQDYVRAQRHLDEALRLESDPRVDWLLAQATVLSQPATREQAIAMLQRALAMAEASGDGGALIEVRTRLTELLRRTGRNDEALVILQASVPWLQARLGERHPRVLVERLQLSAVMRDSGRLDEMLATADVLTAEIEREFGANSAFASRARYQRGMALSQAKRYPEAAAEFRRSADISEAVNGPSHIQSHFARFQLALALFRSGGHDDEAEAQIAGVLDTLVAQYSAAHFDLIPTRHAYATILIARDRPGEAYDVLAPALALDVQPMLREYRKTLLRVLPELHAALRCGDDAVDERCTEVATSTARLQAAEKIDTRPYIASDPDVPGRLYLVRGDDPNASKPGEVTWD